MNLKVKAELAGVILAAGAVAVALTGAPAVGQSSPPGSSIRLQSSAKIHNLGASVSAQVVIVCPAGSSAQISVTLTEHSGDGIAQGFGSASRNCTGHPLPVQFAVAAQGGGRPFVSGPAFGQATLFSFGSCPPPGPPGPCGQSTDNRTVQLSEVAPTHALLLISNLAPQSGQNVVFTFGIYCQGLIGSPFTRNITGSGTSSPLSVPAGSQCLASETQMSGWAVQPNQSYQPVVGGVNQTLTFTQTPS